MPLARANPTSIEKRNPTSIELGGGVLPPPTEVPVKPTYMVTALPVAIRIDIDSTSGSNRATGHRVRIRRRNDDDTAWQPVQAWIDIGRARSYIYTNYSTTQAIEAGRRYEVKVIAYNIIGDSPEGDYVEVVPLTNIPAIPVFSLDAHDTAIRLTLTKVADPLMARDPTYEYFIEERNADDTAWVPDVDGSQIITSDPFGAAGTHRIISENDTQIVIDVLRLRLAGQSTHDLINDRAYRIRVRSDNDAGDSDWSAYMEATPMMGVVPAQPPGIPTFTLSLDPSAFGDIVINISRTGAQPVTHWITRDRVKGTTDWNTVVETADASEFTFTATAGQTIEVQIAARNSAGDSDFAPIQEIRIIDVPNMPTLALTAVPAGFNVQITDAVAGDPADNAFFRYREGTSGDWIEGTVLQVRSLKETTLYQVQAWTTNDAGRSTAAVATVTTLMIPLVLPLVPTFTVSVVSVFNPFDFFIAPTQNAAEPTTITHWNIRYREQGTQSWTDERVTNVAGATYGNTLDRLTVRGKTYEFQVAAENSDGVGTYAASQTITFIDVPNRPDLFLTAQAGGFDVRIVASPTGSRADSTHFRYREQGTTDWTDAGPSITEIRRLDGLTTYEVQAWTSNRAGESLRALRTVTTLAVRMRAGKAFMFGGESIQVPGMPTGVFERVGAATNFGIGETFPSGLAAIGNTLYMVGETGDVLYILNAVTGFARRVGSTTLFGVGERAPTALASIGDILYMIGEGNDALYTLNTDTGVATRVGSANQFGVGETFPQGLGAIGDTLYMLGARNDALYTLDTDTGIATRVGSANQFGVVEGSPRGLASIGNTLYMVGLDTDALYILDTATGIATRVGSANQFGVRVDFVSGLAAIGNTLYMLSNIALYRSLQSRPTTVQKPPQHFIVGGKSFSIGV